MTFRKAIEVTEELADYILGKRTELGFDEPCPSFERSDSQTVRDLILSLTTKGARRLGIRKNTLWYLQQQAQKAKTFRTYNKVRAKLLPLNV